jgi:hypothetical protein
MPIVPGILKTISNLLFLRDIGEKIELKYFFLFLWFIYALSYFRYIKLDELYPLNKFIIFSSFSSERFYFTFFNGLGWFI